MGSSLGRLNSGPGLRFLVERYEGLGLGSVYSAGDCGVEDIPRTCDGPPQAWQGSQSWSYTSEA